jgi:hypothetical protein
MRPRPTKETVRAGVMTSLSRAKPGSLPPTRSYLLHGRQALECARGVFASSRSIWTLPSLLLLLFTCSGSRLARLRPNLLGGEKQVAVRTFMFECQFFLSSSSSSSFSFSLSSILFLFSTDPTLDVLFRIYIACAYQEKFWFLDETHSHGLSEEASHAVS